jgi:hypothetical protein
MAGEAVAVVARNKTAIAAGMIDRLKFGAPL